MDNNVLIAFAMTMVAGLSTGIGSLIALKAKHGNQTFLSVALGFSAGVMVFVSLVEILPKATESMEECLSGGPAYLAAILAFFAGMGVVAAIDKLVPEAANPHEVHLANEMQSKPVDEKSLMHMGIVTAVAITIHNFPEGIATFMAAVNDPMLGLPIMFAVAVHNIPEGIAVAVPIYYATGSRYKAFWYSFLSGMAEPVGALAGYLILLPFLTPWLFGLVFAAVGGIMVYISFDELLPGAERYGHHHAAIYGVLGGMALMAASLALFAF